MTSRINATVHMGSEDKLFWKISQNLEGKYLGWSSVLGNLQSHARNFAKKNLI